MFRSRRRKTRRNRLLAVAAGLGVAGAAALVWRRSGNWTGRVALITGASSGLGFLLAKQLAMEGCRLVLCSRDAAELGRARLDLERYGAAVMAIPCDVSDRVQVDCMMEETLVRFGAIDVVINNAGLIQVDPAGSIAVADFERAMAANFWGVVHTTLAALPSMLTRRQGNIINIVATAGLAPDSPQMLPFNCARRAASGFSDGLRAELRGKGVRVTTIIPNVTAAGSYLSGILPPGPLTGAERAAVQILHAAKRGQAERTLSIPANLLGQFHPRFPETTTPRIGVMGGWLPVDDSSRP